MLRRTQGDAERADDLTQEVFLALISDLGSRPAESDVLAWLYTVAHRRFVDDVRRRRRQVTVAPISGVELVGPDGLEYGSAVARALLIALQQVSPIQRRVFVMKILEGRRFAEIAQTIGTSEGAARNHLLRGLRTIREMLKRYGVDP